MLWVYGEGIMKSRVPIRDMQIMLFFLPYYAMLQCQNPFSIMLNKHAYYALKIGKKINK